VPLREWVFSSSPRLVALIRRRRGPGQQMPSPRAPAGMPERYSCVRAYGRLAGAASLKRGKRIISSSSGKRRCCARRQAPAPQAPSCRHARAAGSGGRRIGAAMAIGPAVWLPGRGPPGHRDDQRPACGEAGGGADPDARLCFQSSALAEVAADVVARRLRFDEYPDGESASLRTRSLIVPGCEAARR
jgi:hypothetical protein